MRKTITTRAIGLAAFMLVHQSSHAFFFFIPIPNLAKPAPLGALIDALEKSDETKAVAYVSEDKTFGAKYWAWGQFSGHVPQAEADRIAMSKCMSSLATARSQSAGGKPLYDFGTKTCELHSFANKTVSPRANEWQPTPQVQTKPAIPVNATPAAQAMETPSTSVLPPLPAPQGQPPAEPTARFGQPASSPQIDLPASQSPKTPAPTPSTDNSVAKRLRDLDALRREGLITEIEYQEKRKAILSAM